MFKKTLCAGLLMSVALSTSAIASNIEQQINVLTPQVAAEQAANEFIKEWDKHVSCKSQMSSNDTANNVVNTAASTNHYVVYVGYEQSAFVNIVDEKVDVKADNKSDHYINYLTAVLNRDLASEQRLVSVKGKLAMNNLTANTIPRLEEPISF